MHEPQDSIGKTVLSVIDESEVPDMGPEIRIRYVEEVEAQYTPVGGRTPRSMVQNMCFWEGKTKYREARAQEESVDYLSPGCRL
jgi:hypothetical protein